MPFNTFLSRCTMVLFLFCFTCNILGNSPVVVVLSQTKKRISIYLINTTNKFDKFTLEWMQLLIHQIQVLIKQGTTAYFFKQTAQFISWITTIYLFISWRHIPLPLVYITLFLWVSTLYPFQMKVFPSSFVIHTLIHSSDPYFP